MPGADDLNDIDENEELILETEVPEADPEEAPDDDGEEEQIITLGDEAEADPTEDTPLIRQLRKQLRDTKRALREKDQAPIAQPQIVDPGPEPDFEDFEYDTAAFKVAHAEWVKKSLEFERKQAEAKEAKERADASWQNELTAYEKAKASLAVPGKEEAEEEALAKLSQLQQAIIVKHPQNAAIMIALGKFPKKLGAVSAITDPVNFAYAIADIGRELKVTARRKAPEPEGIVRGDARIASGGEARRLEQLEKEAERTGDRTKLLQFKRQMKAA